MELDTKIIKKLKPYISGESYQQYFLILSSTCLRKTPGLLVNQIQQIRNIFIEAEKNGCKIQGIKRKLIAKELRISDGSVNRYDRINTYLSTTWRNELVIDSISVDTALELLKMNLYEQDKFFEKITDTSNLTKDEVTEYIKNLTS